MKLKIQNAKWKITTKNLESFNNANAQNVFTLYSISSLTPISGGIFNLPSPLEERVRVRGQLQIKKK
ncbi:MAG: hypothetical protein AMJ89_06580 [candidate division Zixibacteria bacterium SM23_73]|nr:MAG: hypothetical protein AMJ89_06580 [candidate division Zixibacteria bacterium SM23_73]